MERVDFLPRKRDSVSTEVTNQPKLVVDRDTRQGGAVSVGVNNLDPDLVSFLGRHPLAGQLLQSVLRVRVTGESPEGEDLPDVFGRYHVREGGVRFIPYFPFEPGCHYRASFDPRPLSRPELSEVLTLDFSLPSETNTVPTQVKHVFPSGDLLPENLLRFYVCFSSSMQRGRAEEQIRLLDSDGRPAPDVLYRPPVELWDRSMRHLTILLDPGRLKRGVGPNRELGPPLKAGQEYTLAIGSRMFDLSGCPLRESFYKTFRVTKAVREPIDVEQWKILLPATDSHQPLALLFPRTLDWAPLWHAITIAQEGGQPIHGRIAIAEGERRWSFTPSSPWSAGPYHVRIASSLEDVCGNGLSGAFDRPLRPGSDLAIEPANCPIPFHLDWRQ
jgi:hypothetical protein